MSVSSLPLYVVDASIPTKWYLSDEELALEADRVSLDYRLGRTRLLAPDHIRQEVANAVRNVVRRGRISQADAEVAIAEDLTWDMPLVDTGTLLESGLTHAFRDDCALYDALYIALAELLGCAFVYADRFTQALWIEDYGKT